MTQVTTTTKMRLHLLIVALPLMPLFAHAEPSHPDQWTIYITNDACSDYTWGFNESDTRHAYADVVRAHLDQMNQTDRLSPENQDRYNMSVAQEAEAFLEFYPDRKQELIRRVREGRLEIGAVYDNALWGFQSSEGMLRAFYPTMRMQKAFGFPMEVVEHMEQPGLPWGVASLMAGSGFKWVSMPYYDFDATFSGLTNPPLFHWIGPDGTTIGVRMDKFASDTAHYTEGAYLLSDPTRIAAQWLPHYQSLPGFSPGPLLASGTHGDNNPDNWKRAAGFAQAIIRYNAQTGDHARLVNATLPMFFHAVEASPLPLTKLSGDFGDSWDVWPVTLAAYASSARLGEHDFLSAESLLAQSPHSNEATRTERESAERDWIMLADHAWNGTDDANRSVNAELRKHWAESLQQRSLDLTRKGWEQAQLVADSTHLTIYNPISAPHAALVAVEVASGINGVEWGGKPIPSQLVEESGKRTLYFVSPHIPGFGFVTVALSPQLWPAANTELQANQLSLENKWYRLTVDPKTGGIASLIARQPNRELRVPDSETAIAQTTYFDGALHTLSNVTSSVVAAGPVFARLKVSGEMDGIAVVNYITLYAELDQIDLDISVDKPVSTKEQRLTQSFPVVAQNAVERIETVGAVLRPEPQPVGDLLPGADTHRFVVQGFADATGPDGLGLTVAPREAFFLRKDLGQITFESIGNDQDFPEVSHDQHGVTQFRFRYSLRSHSGGYNNAETVAWSRQVANPLLVQAGTLAKQPLLRVAVDPARAMLSTLKPSEDGRGSLLRIWETAGRSGDLLIALKGYRRAYLTDLLERPIKPLPLHQGSITVDLKAHGFAAVQLLP